MCSLSSLFHFEVVCFTSAKNKMESIEISRFSFRFSLYFDFIRSFGLFVRSIFSSFNVYVFVCVRVVVSSSFFFVSPFNFPKNQV